MLVALEASHTMPIIIAVMTLVLLLGGLTVVMLTGAGRPHS